MPSTELPLLDMQQSGFQRVVPPTMLPDESLQENLSLSQLSGELEELLNFNVLTSTNTPQTVMETVVQGKPAKVPTSHNVVSKEIITLDDKTPEKHFPEFAQTLNAEASPSLNAKPAVVGATKENSSDYVKKATKNALANRMQRLNTLRGETNYHLYQTRHVSKNIIKYTAAQKAWLSKKEGWSKTAVKLKSLEHDRSKHKKSNEKSSATNFNEELRLMREMSNKLKQQVEHDRQSELDEANEARRSQKPTSFSSVRQKQRNKALEKQKKHDKQMRDLTKQDLRMQLDIKRKLLAKAVLEQRIKRDKEGDKDNFFSSGDFLLDEENVQRAALQNAHLKWTMHPYFKALHEGLGSMQELSKQTQERHLMGVGSVGIKLSGNSYCCSEHESFYETKAIKINMVQGKKGLKKKGRSGRKNKKGGNKKQNGTNEVGEDDATHTNGECIFQRIYNHLKWIIGEKIVKQWGEARKQ